MGLFVTGTLFYVLGLADAVAQRSAMQDSADATAFAAAVVHARGMNAVVLCNIVMAALLSVLVALRLVATIMLAVVSIAAAMSFLNPGFAAVIPPASLTAKKADRAYESAKRLIDPALEAVQMASDSLATVMPTVAALRAIEQGSQNHAPRVTAAGAVPESETLPVEAGSPALLCSKAGEFAGDLVTIPIRLLPLGDELSGLTSGLIAELAAAAPGWFCGLNGGGGERTRHTRKQTFRLPLLEDDRACLERNDTDACTRMATSLEQARHDQTTGDCKVDCGPDGPYSERVTAARVQCKPGRGALRNYTYQVQQLRRVEVRTGTAWRQEGPTTVLGVHLRSSPRAPCITRADWRQGDFRLWIEDPGSVERPRPVCLTREPQRQAIDGNVNRRIVTTHEVSRILRCEETREVDVTPAGMGDDARGTPSKPRIAPKALRDDVVHGGSPFQLRSLSVGRDLHPLPQRVLEGVGRGQSSTLWNGARRAGRVGIAQAEYHFDGALTADAMWQTAWTARLTRLQLPQDPPTMSAAMSEGAEAVAGALSPCGGLPICRALLNPSLGTWMAH